MVAKLDGMFILEIAVKTSSQLALISLVLLFQIKIFYLHIDFPDGNIVSYFFEPVCVYF